MTFSLCQLYFYLPRLIFGDYFKITAKKIFFIFVLFSAETTISDSEIETAFDSQIQSVDVVKLNVWILGLCTPISHCVKKDPQSIEKARNHYGYSSLCIKLHLSAYLR